MNYVYGLYRPVLPNLSATAPMAAMSIVEGCHDRMSKIKCLY